MKIYIAGPMSGYPEFNFPAFFEAQKEFEEKGWKVFNPAQKDIESHGTAIMDNPTGDPILAAKKDGFDIREALRWDTDAICKSDAILMLRGWEHSPGACAEHSLARAIQKHVGREKMEIIYQ
jgi:hypothetical protein